MGTRISRFPKQSKIDRQRAQRALNDDAVAAGNPDIRVPENIKNENGLCVGRAEEEEDAEELSTPSAENEACGKDQKATHPYLGEEETQNTRDYPTKGQEGPKKLELCHVPGWMWMNQALQRDHDKKEYQNVIKET
ncbi:hypothetical protein NDU88_006338 [Pleurodeles waltl]|uniref:Uncharacterized protein n=1 Tax=Pleurodeles waltl TaxID=8319 RepID=A0AAV7PLI0_PLEWA|nr:hypothetical protein NDU88_006338 [Pleurodeles waltl]